MGALVKILFWGIIVGIIGAVIFLPKDTLDTPQQDSVQKKNEVTEEEVSLEKDNQKKQESTGIPLTRACDRVTKKPFGIWISSATSPVQPERFNGYHTGADFEIFSEEAASDVVVRAICDGEVLVKRFSLGYGGLLVTSCSLEEQIVRVIYGHLALSSIQKGIGEVVQKGDVLGLLGENKSHDTDGERKHLHLGIRKERVMDVSGYVKEEKDLGRWMDPVLLICKAQ